ncbi:MAG: S-adenosylmethionine-dependent methyltransferase [Chitinophagales bacterium]|nr:MAG: S-adenosylmethionine-dependent methyltransferase [Chitinophagales bacterium]
MKRKQEGKLYIIPAPIGNNEGEFLAESVKRIVYSLRHFVVEKEKTARRILRHIGYTQAFDDTYFTEINKNTRPEKLLPIIDIIRQGISVGLMAEAGMPCLADPGETLVELAHQHNITVVPLAGPSAIMLALVASGLGANGFAFWGYLPVKPLERRKQLLELERLSRKYDEAQIFIETPYRNMQLFEEILKACLDNTLVCIAREINQPGQFIRTLPVKQWRKTKVSLHKRPTVFILSAR